MKSKVTGIYSNNQGYRTIGGKRHYFRSLWEVNFAKYLQFLKDKNVIIDWEYEPKTFWFEAIKRGVRSYKPDFRIKRPDGTHYWAEVKGFMDAKSKTKIKRLKKYFPEEELRVVDKLWFKEQKRKSLYITEEWENQYTEAEAGNGNGVLRGFV